MTTAYGFGCKERGIIHAEDKTLMESVGRLNKSRSSSPFNSKGDIKWRKWNHLSGHTFMWRKSCVNILKRRKIFLVHLTIGLISSGDSSWEFSVGQLPCVLAVALHYETASSQDLL